MIRNKSVHNRWQAQKLRYVKVGENHSVLGQWRDHRNIRSPSWSAPRSLLWLIFTACCLFKTVICTHLNRGSRISHKVRGSSFPSQMVPHLISLSVFEVFNMSHIKMLFQKFPLAHLVISIAFLPLFFAICISVFIAIHCVIRTRRQNSVSRQVSKLPLSSTS